MLAGLILGFLLGAGVDAIVGSRHGVLAPITFLAAYAIAGFGLYRALFPPGPRRSPKAQPRELSSLPPDAFQQTVADILPSLGYRDVRFLGKSRTPTERIACRDGDGYPYLVLCRQTGQADTIGAEEVQDFMLELESKHHGSHGVLVTTVSLSRSAAYLARKYNIAVIDRQQLRDLVRRESTANRSTA